MPLSPVASLSLSLLAALADGTGAGSAKDAGDDFAAEASLLYRIAACGPVPATGTGIHGIPPSTTGPLPGSLPAEVADKHCQQMRFLINRWRRRWLEQAVPFLANIVPATVPTEVVYPFGGGDLFTALAAFPHAVTITTLSLEPSGNPLTFGQATPAEQEHALGAFRDHVRRLSYATHSKTTNLLAFRHEALPDQLAFALLALVAFDMEPVSLRYFEVDDAGTLHYLTKSQIDAHTKRRFANMELGFRRRGDASAPRRLHRHLQTNLADQPLGRTPGVIAHLASKGHVAAMTKAASFLLWSPSFARIRNYLLEHADWMISDATGIPPHFAAANFEQETWGHFTGAFLAASPEHEQDFVRLWASQPTRALPFGFGYPDKEGNDHLLVTRRRAAAP
ncbi:MAG: hypothetical protein QOI66_3396 [Myxococcales bacterium]|nr:hypothetical protein [Myxococcales bacterium]